MVILFSNSVFVSIAAQEYHISRSDQICRDMNLIGRTTTEVLTVFEGLENETKSIELCVNEGKTNRNDANHNVDFCDLCNFVESLLSDYNTRSSPFIPKTKKLLVILTIEIFV